MHKPQSHNAMNFISRITMPQGVVITVSHEQPTGISLAEYLEQVDANPPSAR